MDAHYGLDDEHSLYRLYCGIKGISPNDNFQVVGKTGKSEFTKTAKRSVSLFVRGDIHNFNTARREALLATIAGICSIPNGAIILKSIDAASVHIEIHLPTKAAEYLCQLAVKCDVSLVSLGVPSPCVMTTWECS